MRKFQFMTKILLLVIIVLQGALSSASAKQLNSVKDCLEDPSKCSEEQLEKKAEDETNTKTANATDDETPSVGLTFWDFLKMIFATMFVIALLYIILRYLNKRSRSFTSTQLVQNLGGTALGTNRSIQIVKVGNRVMVVGVGEDVQLLKEIDNEDEARGIIDEYNNRMDHLVQPSDIVTKLIERTKLVKQTRTTGEQTFSTVLKSQLEELSKGRKKLFDEFEHNKKGPDDK